MLSDPNASVRENAVIVLQELYRFYAEGITNLLNKSNIRPVQLKEILDRFENIQIEENIILIPELEEVPKSTKKKTLSIDLIESKTSHTNLKPITHSVSPTDNGMSSNSDIESMIVTERDLPQEFEQISAILKNSKEDWNNRIKAMKIIQSIVVGGAYSYPSFFTAFNGAKESLGKQVCFDYYFF